MSIIGFIDKAEVQSGLGLNFSISLWLAQAEV